MTHAHTEAELADVTGFTCPAGTADSNWHPSACELLEWYTDFVEAMKTADPTHVPPPWLPRIDLIRALFESSCRPIVNDHREGQDQWHVRKHDCGWDH
jgi:hypothetical protein